MVKCSQVIYSFYEYIMSCVLKTWSWTSCVILKYYTVRCDSNQIMICLQLHNVSSFYSSYIHPQIKYEYHIGCEWKDTVNAGKSIENCLENVNQYLAIYLLFIRSLSYFHIHILCSLECQQLWFMAVKNMLKKPLAWLKRQKNPVKSQYFISFHLFRIPEINRGGWYRTCQV